MLNRFSYLYNAAEKNCLQRATITRLEEYLKCTYTLITAVLNIKVLSQNLPWMTIMLNNRYRSYHIVPSHRYAYPIILHILPVTTIIMLCV